jgi:acetyl-CoA C-acetyltransferase/acetyl-CoA acyltransferase
MAPAGKDLSAIEADQLGAYAVKELLARAPLEAEDITETILGNVAQPAHAANIARVIALESGVPAHIPAQTVHRNCASGMQSVSTAAEQILLKGRGVYLTGGVESMSNIPFLYSKEMKQFFTRLSRSKSTWQKLKTLLGFRLRYLKPEIGVMQGLTDPVSGLIMGMTAEVLARDFHITREQQDEYALLSHQRALQAIRDGILQEELVPVPVDESQGTLLDHDKGPRENSSMEKLGKLKPYFDRKNGTVTVGNSSQITDGAAALLVMGEKEAKKRGIRPLGYIRDYRYAALEPERMGLGPVYATAKLLDATKATMKDFQRIELNEAFAAQVIANELAFPSQQFARERLGRDKAVGELNRDIMNVNGGAISIGHPVGMTGARLILTLLKELHRSGNNTGLATLCVGGGQGAAFFIEAS